MLELYCCKIFTSCSEHFLFRLFLVQVQGSGFHGADTWKQPGPVEAVKQMLFRLQAVEAELERQQNAPEAPPPVTHSLKTPERNVGVVEAEL